MKDSLYNLGKASLIVLGVSGLVLVAATMPNAIQALSPLVKKQRGKVNRRSLERALKRLQKERLVEFVSKGGKTYLQVTNQGKKKLREFDFDTLVLPVPQVWDRHWTVVLFDIPESKKVGRDAISRKFREIGFYALQRSVLVHPSDCRDEIDFIAKTFGLERFALHFRVPSLGYAEARARSHFNLL